MNQRIIFEDGTFKRVKGIYNVDGEIPVLDLPTIVATEVVTETLTYNSETHKLVRLDDLLVTIPPATEEDVTTYEWHMNRYNAIALSEQEIIDRRNAEADAADQTMDAVTIKALLRATLPVDADDDTLATVSSLFPAWRPGQIYTAGDLLQHGDQTVRVVQGHASQLDWNPLSTPAIYSVIVPTPPGSAYPAWQVWDGNNANLYQIGDRVTHNALDWEATLGNNHWEPGGGTGWQQL